MTGIFALLAAVSLQLAQPVPTAAPDSIDAVARSYVELELGVALLNPDVPNITTPRVEELARARIAKRDAARIITEANALVARLDVLGPGTVRLDAMRRRFLRARLNTLLLNLRSKDTLKLPAAEDVRLRFGFTPQFRPLGEFDAAIGRLDKAITGPGTLPQRIAAMKGAAQVPPGKLETVFNAALAECRRRTKAHLALPAESTQLLFVDDPMTPASNEYVANGRSITRISKSIPTDIDNLIRSACHEVYPGHHTHSTNVDASLYRGRGWAEFGVALDGETAFPVSEASAEYGVGLAFPVEERIAFQRDVLYPLAGLSMRNEAGWRA